MVGRSKVRNFNVFETFLLICLLESTSPGTAGLRIQQDTIEHSCLSTFFRNTMSMISRYVNDFIMFKSLLIWLLQHTFMTLGPFATWDFIHKTSASIPCQRKIKDHIEHEINHFLRGKAHTSPEAEEDIKNLQAAYCRDKIHVLQPGRKLNARDRVKDYVALSSEGTKLKKMIERWVDRRDVDISTRQVWDRLKASY